MAAEVGLAAFSSVVSEAAKALFEPIMRNISYVFKYQSYIDGLKNKVKELGYRREMVQQPVSHAILQGDEIYKGVADRLNSVDEFTQGVAKPITDGEDRAKKLCFKGFCPNLMSRYKLSKQAARAAGDAANLLGKGNFTVVSYRPAPDRTELMHVRDYEGFDSRMKVFQDVMEALKDEKLNKIGVYGMGGVGKTTLVKQVAKQVMEDKLFDNVVMAEVTQTPDHQKIQDKIAYDLGMEFGLHESVFQRAGRLRERLKKEKRVLVILDNIWKKLELDAVGIPSENDENDGIPFENDENERKDHQRRCTIILTSRSRDLLSDDMNSQKNFFIEVLSKEEAGHLFEKIVGDSVKQSNFQPIADDIVERCGGLPVALNTIANALKNKSLYIWKDALDKLRNSSPSEIHGMDANVYSSIALSYNFLESDEAKSLFLLCGLHRAGDSVNVHYLMRYGMGLGLLKNVYTLETTRNRVYALIDNLKASCLLLDGDGENDVKMHDIIHDVAISIATKKNMFNISNVPDMKEEIEKAMYKSSTAISLPCRDIQELPERLECPQLKLFLLFANYNNPFQIPDLFFQRMKELKVLHFSRTQLLSLPSSQLGCLINLHTLCSDGCRLEDIAIVGLLKKLEILSFRDSSIKELPIIIGELTRLRLFDLSNCRSLKVIAPNLISKLTRLEELYMTGSFTQWEKVEGGSNASLVELKGLSKLTTLEIGIKDVQIVLPDFVFERLERYKICIGDWWVWSYEYETSRLMKLDGLEKSFLLGRVMKMLLKSTENLNLKKLKGFQNVVKELDGGESFLQLKHFYLESCSEILHIVSLVGQVHCKVFPLLESLSLNNLVNLEKICHGQLTNDQSFSNLRSVEVNECSRLKHLFSFTMAKRLSQLREVKVTDCRNLEMIVGPDMEKPTTISGSKEIIAEDDPNEKAIFSNLEKVTVRDCKRLKYVFSCSMACSLTQLQHIEISGCASMKAVVVNTTRLKEDERKLVFPKLHSLNILFLSSLTSFAIGIHSVEFPFLRQLMIRHCSDLRRFISMSSSEDNIHTETQPQQLFDEKAIFPNLEKVEIIACNSFSLKYMFSYSVVNSLRRLQRLEIHCCYSLKAVVVNTTEFEREERKLVFPKLHFLDLIRLQRLSSFAMDIHSLEFPSLVQLRIYGCNNLRRFSSLCSSENNNQTEVQPQPLFDETAIFPNLEEVIVSDCRSLKYVFSYSMVSSFVQLQNLKIKGCDLMEAIVVKTSGFGRDEGKLVFPKLYSLELERLQKLKTFAMGILSAEFATLLELKIYNCNELRRFISMSSSEGYIYIGTQPQSFFDEKAIFPNLEKVTINSCEGDLVKYMFSYSMVSSLVRLQHLEIQSCYSMEAVIVNTKGFGRDEGKLVFPKLHFLELGLLQKLKSFATGIHSVEFPSLVQLKIYGCDYLRRFLSMDLSEDNIHTETRPKSFFDETVRLPSLEVLKINKLRNFREIWHHQLASDDCSFTSSAIPANLLWSLNNLRSLKVRDCDSVEEVFHLEERNADEHFGPLFPDLKKLKLTDLPKLKRFCNLTGNIIELPNLSKLWIENCPDMESFISSSTSIKLTANKEPQEQTTEENFLVADIQPLFDEKMVSLPWLRELKISGLSKLLLLWKENSQPSEGFQRLRTLEISKCNKLENLVLSLVPFKYLTTLTVWKCRGLTNFMTLSAAKNLMLLKRMYVIDCKNIENIIEHGGEEVKDCIVFNKLRYLVLNCLPSLTGIWLGNYTLEFPSLEIVVVRECPKMKTFSTEVLSTPKLHEVQVKEEDEEIEEEEGGDDDDSEEQEDEEEDSDDDGYEDEDEEEDSYDEEQEDDDDDEEEDHDVEE